jgi:hypothetical protein
MSPDPIVAEIRRIREEFAARFNYDTGLILKYVQERDAAGDRQVIRRPPHRPVLPAKVTPERSPADTSDRS